MGIGLSIAIAFLVTGCRQSLTNPSLFDISSVPQIIKNYEWKKLKDDKQDDGSSTESADGKAFYYFFDKESDVLWFRFDLYNQINIDSPAVSVSFDTDADQTNGINWYGANSNFKFERMASVGPLEKRGDKYFGYNGITDEPGVKSQNWINVKKGNITLHFDIETNSYFLGVKRSDIETNLHKFNVIGSVGQNALWNDDIGDEGYSTIDLNLGK